MLPKSVCGFGFIMGETDGMGARLFARQRALVDLAGYNTIRHDADLRQQG
jgi:hypothetical protein